MTTLKDDIPYSMGLEYITGMRFAARCAHRALIGWYPTRTKVADGIFNDALRKGFGVIVRGTPLHDKLGEVVSIGNDAKNNLTWEELGEDNLIKIELRLMGGDYE